MNRIRMGLGGRRKWAIWRGRLAVAALVGLVILVAVRSRETPRWPLATFMRTAADTYMGPRDDVVRRDARDESGRRVVTTTYAWKGISDTDEIVKLTVEHHRILYEKLPTDVQDELRHQVRLMVENVALIRRSDGPSALGGPFSVGAMYGLADRAARRVMTVVEAKRRKERAP